MCSVSETTCGEEPCRDLVSRDPRLRAQAGTVNVLTEGEVGSALARPARVRATDLSRRLHGRARQSRRDATARSSTANNR